MRARRYKIACLAGDGIGPELMAEASRAVEAVSRLHGFAVDEVHVPFGGDAVRRFGHPLVGAGHDRNPAPPTPGIPVPSTSTTGDQGTPITIPGLGG